MGNLISCCFGVKNEEDERDERERLLDHAAGDGMVHERTSLNGDLTHSSNFGNGYGTVTAPDGRLESNAWNRTLNKMANKVIDVSSIEANSSGIEPNEFQERQKLYSSKVVNSKIPSILKNERLKTQPKFESERKIFNNLLLEPISTDDLFLINEFAEKTLEAIRTGFVVNVTEDLVVQFNPGV